MDRPPLEALDALLASPPGERAARLDARAAARVVELLASEDRTAQRNAADRLAPLAGDCPALAAALRAALASPRQRLRWGAAYTLGRAGHRDPELWPAAREAMALSDGDQRWAAAELACALARAHVDLERDLLAALGDASPVLRKMALYCLRDLGAAGAAAGAVRATADPEPGVRLAALSTLAALPRDALGAPGEGAVASALVAAVSGDPDAGVRRAAAAAIGRLAIDRPAVRAALESAQGASDESLARAATAALARIDAARAPN